MTITTWLEGQSFEWDEQKAFGNFNKHKVSFSSAIRVFFDPFAVIWYDEAHSETEDRFLIIGRNNNDGELVVAHCWRGENVIRLISARRPTRGELINYRERVAREGRILD